jgi:hypothetical protein
MDLTASASGDGGGQSIDFEGGLIITDDNAFVEYGGETYEVGTDTFASFKDSFEQAAAQGSGDQNADAAQSFKEGCEQAVEAQGGDASACDFEISGWFTNLTSDGTEDLDGTEVNHVSGDIDVGQMLDDLIGIAQSVPGASAQVDQSQVDQVSEAISNASFGLYSGTDDDLLRKLDLDVSIDPSAIAGATPVPIESLDLSLSAGVSDVNEDQTIEAPSGAKPISDLLGQLGIGGLGPLGGLGGSGLDLGGGSTGGGGGNFDFGGGSGGSDSSQAYFDCIQQAAGDPDAAAACASELQ